MFKFRKKNTEAEETTTPKDAAEKIITRLYELTPKFKKYEDYFIKTIKPYIKITPEDSSNLELWQSKFGGFPYLPKGVEYPKNSNGDYLYLVAQINFEEMPKLENFPDKGILEFFLSPNSIKGNIDGNFGVDKTSQKDIRILYFSEINKNNLQADFSFLKPITRDNFPDYSNPFPVIKIYALKLEKNYAPISPGDYQFFEYNFFEDKLGDKNYKLRNAYVEKFNHKSSKIGGYPTFAQGDPREFHKYSNEKYILLFMMGNTREIMQGDGILNFFIKKKDLFKKDFSNILAYFDCE